MNKEKTEKRIVIIICYFGRIPWYFYYFLHSCKYNPAITFCILTDNIIYEDLLPKNVVIINKSIDDINTIATERLGFKTHIGHPYKLCDFKPAYGFLFPEFIKGYDFWGHGDIDVIFGDILAFMTYELLYDYDVISIRPDWIDGCFNLYKNSEKTNTLFKCSKDYKKVLCSSIHYCFDEANFAHKQFTEGIPFNKIRSEIESMTHTVKRMDREKYIRAYFDLHVIEGIPGKMKWDNGTLIYKNTFEVMLYHLIKLKKIYLPKRIPKKIPNVFYISPTRIYT